MVQSPDGIKFFTEQLIHHEIIFFVILSCVSNGPVILDMFNNFSLTLATILDTALNIATTKMRTGS